MSDAHLSYPARQLLRAVIARSGLEADRIFVGRFHSVDWQSLTFTGERHEISLRLTGSDPARAVASLRSRLADAEWPLIGHVVADILIVAERGLDDGSIMLDLEALTLQA